MDMPNRQAKQGDGQATGSVGPIAHGATGTQSGYPAGDPRGSTWDAGTPSKTEELGDQAMQTVMQAKDMAQDTVGTVAHQAQEQVSLQLSNGLDQAADLVGSLADAIETVGQQLQQNEQPGLASYAGRAAHQLDRFSTYLEDCEPEDIVREAEHFARRQPAVFLGGAFALGFFAMRFLKSSSPRARAGNQPRRTDSTRPRLARSASRYPSPIPEAGTVPPMSPGTGRPASAGPSDRGTGQPTGYSGPSGTRSGQRPSETDLPHDYSPTV